VKTTIIFNFSIYLVQSVRHERLFTDFIFYILYSHLFIFIHAVSNPTKDFQLFNENQAIWLAYEVSASLVSEIKHGGPPEVSVRQKNGTVAVIMTTTLPYRCDCKKSQHTEESHNTLNGVAYLYTCTNQIYK
jgi:hypothetical protein